ncbi:unnamed protein product [Rhizopus stolonifer]
MTPTSERQAKRIKISKSIKDNFRSDLFDASFQTTLTRTIQTSLPYPHCKINDLVCPDLLYRVQQEIYHHLCFTTKETDIYKVNQTGDLANLSGLSPQDQKKLPALSELHRSLASPEFRAFVETVTGCDELSSTEMDMSVNTYTAGSHLLNHDDVIGTRRISFILYMPDTPWSAQDGGGLELYPVIQRDTPANEPSITIPPVWNQFCMFEVLPGYSFHAVQEVLSEKKRRLSIQGWFHYKQEIPSLGLPSLLQIQMQSQEPFVHYESDSTVFSLEDKERLAEWILGDYLEPEHLFQFTQNFLEDSCLLLDGFLRPEVWQRIEKRTNRTDEKDGLTKRQLTPHGRGVCEDWYLQGPPVSRRFLRLSDESQDILGQLSLVFKTEAFRRWLAMVCELPLSGYRGMCRRFRPGHDFTLANESAQETLDVTLCLSQAIESDYGAYDCYMAKGEEEIDDPATYRASEEGGALLTLPANSNQLSIVLRDPEVLRFIKYVSARAPGSRWDVAFEYETCMTKSK